MSTIRPAYEKLYYIYYACWDACYGHPGRGCYEVQSVPITRVTAKRIYFRDGKREKFLDRAEIERDGEAWHKSVHAHLYLEPPELHDHRAPQTQTVAQLRRQMAECHPDRGGDPTEFRAAHARYTAAKAVTR